MTDDIGDYAVHVVFNERGFWSRKYTYKSRTPYAIGDVVIVPTNTFYAIGKVVGSEKGYPFNKNIVYKYVVKNFNSAELEKAKTNA
jgi:hypothetical protein